MKSFWKRKWLNQISMRLLALVSANLYERYLIATIKTSDGSFKLTNRQVWNCKIDAMFKLQKKLIFGRRELPAALKLARSKVSFLCKTYLFEMKNKLKACSI